MRPAGLEPWRIGCLTKRAVVLEACQYEDWEHGIEYRLTKTNHPWTNDRAEPMYSILEEPTVWRYHYATHGQLEERLTDTMDAYNFSRRVKIQSDPTPDETCCIACTEDSDRS